MWWLVFLLPLGPLGLLTYDAYSFNLGADPALEIVKQTGLWAINLLWITLLITPLKRLFGLKVLLRYRRMMGLYSLFYAGVHLLAFVTFILGWQIDLLMKELSERPYIVVGFLAFLMLVPLGMTSTKAMQRRLGKQWQKLHKLVYIIALLVMVHFIWQIRSDYFEQFIYGCLLMVLLGVRLYGYVAKKIKQSGKIRVS
ncbi:MAG: sulfite oxidase heme-binding subunit YedZ [Pontibacterium sp.]